MLVARTDRRSPRHGKGAQVISHESIYRFIYAQISRTNEGAWRHYLPHAKFKGGWRARPGGSSASFIRHRVPIAQRPRSADDRSVPGHWAEPAKVPAMRSIVGRQAEGADLMAFSTYFCNTHSPWQKGGVENAIRRLRRFLPRKTNLDALSSADIQACATLYNHTPGKCLDFQTQPRHSCPNCCTSYVNPHPRESGNDEEGGFA